MSTTAIPAPANLPNPAAMQAPVPVPSAPAGNGEPIQMVGQQPGMVPNKPAEPAKPAAAAPTAPAAKSAEEIMAEVLKGMVPAKSESSFENLNSLNVDGIDDPIIRSMAQVLKVSANGLDLDRVLGNALKTQDANMIDVRYVVEKAGAAAPQIVELARSVVQAVQAKSAAVTQEVHSLAGGEAAWKQSAAVFNELAPQELKLAVKQLLGSTDATQIKAGAKLVSDFGKASGRLTQPGTGRTSGLPAAAGTAEGLTKEQFQIELRKLNPGAVDFESQRAALFQRRSLGKRSGM